MYQKKWLTFFTAISAISFLSLFYIYYNIWPDPTRNFAVPQIVFFAVIFLCFSAGAVPVMVQLNKRFSKPGWQQRDRLRLLRHSGGVGFFMILLVYLQLIRSLNWTTFIILAGVFILSEIFFLTRDSNGN